MLKIYFHMHRNFIKHSNFHVNQVIFTILIIRA